MAKTRGDQHSQVDVEHILKTCGDLLSADHPSDAEASWRMRVIILWWLRQMRVATHDDAALVVKVLTDALNQVGIETYVKALSVDEHIQ